MRWISTAGGPFVLLPQSLSKLWGGCITSYTATYHLSEDGATSVTDYDRACEVTGSSGVLQLAADECLVFGNECCQATWLTLDEFNSYLVRWLYADSEDMILDALSTLSDVSFEKPGIRFRNTSSQLILADSAIPGGGITVKNSLWIDMPVGEYIVDSALYRPHERLGLLIHRFVYRGRS